MLCAAFPPQNYYQFPHSPLSGHLAPAAGRQTTGLDPCLVICMKRGGGGVGGGKGAGGSGPGCSPDCCCDDAETCGSSGCRRRWHLPICPHQVWIKMNILFTSLFSGGLDSRNVCASKHLHRIANSWPETNDGGRFSPLPSTTEEEKENETSVCSFAAEVICVGGKSCPHIIC